MDITPISKETKLLYKHDVLVQQLSSVISNTINYGKE